MWDKDGRRLRKRAILLALLSVGDPSLPRRDALRVTLSQTLGAVMRGIELGVPGGEHEEPDDFGTGG